MGDPKEKFDHIPIEVTSGDLRRLNQAPNLSEFQRQKLEREARKNWDLFYKRNGDRFFKNRHWSRREFSELVDENNSASDSLKYMLEVGCGCGDFALPLIDSRTSDNSEGRLDKLFIYCCDISTRAIEILKSSSVYNDHLDRIKAFTADITRDDFDQLVQAEMDGRRMDIVSLIFVLSTIDPSTLKVAIQNINRALKPGGLVLFRDYAIYDQAMLRFSDKSKICDQFYVRQDGTRAYFFTKEQLCKAFEDDGFKVRSIEYVKRETVNNSTKDKFTRIFLQAKMVKVDQVASSDAATIIPNT